MDVSAETTAASSLKRKLVRKKNLLAHAPAATASVTSYYFPQRDDGDNDHDDEGGEEADDEARESCAILQPLQPEEKNRRISYPFLWYMTYRLADLVHLLQYIKLPVGKSFDVMLESFIETCNLLKHDATLASLTSNALVGVANCGIFNLADLIRSEGSVYRVVMSPVVPILSADMKLKDASINVTLDEQTGAVNAITVNRQAIPLSRLTNAGAGSDDDDGMCSSSSANNERNQGPTRGKERKSAAATKKANVARAPASSPMSKFLVFSQEEMNARVSAADASSR
jgi:hypothetical protein